MPLTHTAAELSAWLRLSLEPGIGSATACTLLGALGLPEQIYAQRATALARQLPDALARQLAAPMPADMAAQVDSALQWVDAPGHHILTLSDPGYPQSLLTIADPPILLYVNGDPAYLQGPALAVVGVGLYAWQTRQSASTAPTYVTEDLRRGNLSLTVSASSTSWSPAVPSDGYRAMPMLAPMPATPTDTARASASAKLRTVAETLIEMTVDYTANRKAFGTTIGAFQNTQFKLAELHSKVMQGRVFVDRCLELHMQGKLDVPTAAAAKYMITDLQCEVIDECVQLHGGYGYMWEYPIARMWADARVQRIYGGTNEIMKTIIARSVLA